MRTGEGAIMKKAAGGIYKDTEFCQLFRKVVEAYHKLEKKQKEVASDLAELKNPEAYKNYTSYVSNWVNGHSLPDVDKSDWKERFQKLFENIDVEAVGVSLDSLMAALEVAWKEDEKRERTELSWPVGIHEWPVVEKIQSEHLAELRTLKELSKENPMCIWLISAGKFPICVSSEVEEKWIANLKAGINYNIIWLLDYFESGNVHRKLSDTFARFDDYEEIGSPTGRIYHYRVHLSALEINAKKHIDTMFHNIEKHTTNKIQPYFEVRDNLEAICTLLRYWTQAGMLITYSLDNCIPNNNALAWLSLVDSTNSKNKRGDVAFYKLPDQDASFIRDAAINLTININKTMATKQ